MDVIEMVDIYLTENGYGGLYSEGSGCACDAGDLAPCGQIDSNCCAGYKHVHPVTGVAIISSDKIMLDFELERVFNSN